MRAYVRTIGAVFGLLTVVHVWRVVAEEPHLAKDPWWVVVTLIAAAVCLWACRLLLRTRAERRRRTAIG